MKLMIQNMYVSRNERNNCANNNNNTINQQPEERSNEDIWFAGTVFESIYFGLWFVISTTGVSSFIYLSIYSSIHPSTQNYSRGNFQSFVLPSAHCYLLLILILIIFTVIRVMCEEIHYLYIHSVSFCLLSVSLCIYLLFV